MSVIVVSYLLTELTATLVAKSLMRRISAISLSNLILNMNIYVRDTSSGATIAAMSADMRGNTDETWSRTLDWLVRNRLLAPGYGLQR